MTEKEYGIWKCILCSKVWGDFSDICSGCGRKGIKTTVDEAVGVTKELLGDD